MLSPYINNLSSLVFQGQSVIHSKVGSVITVTHCAGFILVKTL